jgi:hypothetical protein
MEKRQMPKITRLLQRDQPTATPTIAGGKGPKKIEQEASGGCQKSEYLTLLNTFENATTRDRQGTGEYR